MEQRNLLKRAALISSAYQMIDALLIFCGASFVHLVRFNEWVTYSHYKVFLAFLIILTLVIFNWFSVYRTWRGHLLLKEIGHITLAWITVILVVALIAFLTKTGGSFSRLWVGWSLVVIYLGMIFARIFTRFILRLVRSRGLNQKHIIIVGAGALGKRACDAMLKEGWAGLEPIAFFDDDSHLVGKNHKGVDVLGSLAEVVPYIEEQRIKGNAVDQVWIALPLTAGERIEALQLELQDTATSVYFIPDLFGFNLASYSVDHMVGLPVMNMSASHMRGGNALIKRIEDIVFSSIMLLISAPIFIIVAILIKRESPGPIFFKQHRYGQDGKEILVWKFRSMSVAENGDDFKQATRNDCRVTKVGLWIRKLSIDELPQLINVFQGSMSLVGPRPHAVAHNEFYRKKVQGYMMRHQIKPGITGWAQVNGSRGETSKVEDMEERIRYDLEYIRNWSIALDIRILFMTVLTVLNYKDTY